MERDPYSGEQCLNSMKRLTQHTPILLRFSLNSNFVVARLDRANSLLLSLSLPLISLLTTGRTERAMWLGGRRRKLSPLLSYSFVSVFVTLFLCIKGGTRKAVGGTFCFHFVHLEFFFFFQPLKSTRVSRP
eukprot:TRINITY_DN1243_c1_g1_i3.p1 TRINITY_DN1243_c1_g1~~TRINITY_DN1243_c1_g1_i3.p1  ORF type:complete len:131 (+),score=1.97 TRINITY_DN1243_c1_g1_i3:555-947(+)